MDRHHLSIHKLHNAVINRVKLAVYLEKHRTTEICKQLMCELIKSRPSNTLEFIEKNLKRIADNTQTTRTFVLAAPNFDTDELVSCFRKIYKIPTVVYEKHRMPCDASIILKKFKKLIKKFGLERKNTIFINFPESRSECLKFQEQKINPDHVIEIRSSFKEPNEMLKTENNKFADVKLFYKNVARTLDFVSENSKQKSNSEQAVEEICYRLRETMKNIEPRTEPCRIAYCLRIVMFGRKSSGRKTQAVALSKRFGLVFVEIEQLIYESLHSSCPLGQALRCSLKNNNFSHHVITALIYNRILQKDCLTRGWILVGYPHNVEGFEAMDEFICPPNKIIFLHCREKLALSRCIRRCHREAELNLAENQCEKELLKKQLENVAKEMDYFNLSKNSILKYLSHKNEAIHIDGNHSFNTVRKSIWAHVVQPQCWNF